MNGKDEIESHKKTTISTPIRRRPKRSTKFGEQLVFLLNVCRSRHELSASMKFFFSFAFLRSVSIPSLSGFRTEMWSFVPNTNSTKSTMASLDCSDDEVSSCSSKEEGFECPICWESFNIVENVPYVLWCGHTLCKTCILGLKWAIVKFPNTPIQLPFMISCPWCNFLSLRFTYKGNLAFPRKNYFLLWMVERMNGDRRTSTIINHTEHDSLLQSAGNLARSSHGSYHQSIQRTQTPIGENTPNRQTSLGPSLGSFFNIQTIHAALRKALDLFIRVTAKFPLVIVFLLIVVYVIPASAAILVVFIIITILFALPSFLMIYFAYPVLDWLVREILA